MGHIYEFDPKTIRKMLEKALHDFKPLDASPVDLGKRDTKFDLPDGVVVVDVFTKVLGPKDPTTPERKSLRLDRFLTQVRSCRAG